MKPVDLRAKLEQAAAGKAPRPRGNSVTALEYGAVLPFAQACEALIEASVRPAYYRAGDGDFLEEETDADSIGRLPAPYQALPPLA